MKKIYLSGKNNQLYCLVDDEDFERLSKFKWYLNHKGYVQRNRYYKNKEADTGQILMHRMVLPPKEGLTTDHINGIKTDNQKHNLEHLTNQQNIRRRPGHSKSNVPYKGVYVKKIKSGTRYHAYVRANGKLEFAGYHKTPEEAARAYNKLAKKLHGEHAYQNTI